MKKIVIMPGGFHPFHAGHMALYLAAMEAFPSADVFVAATDDTSGRPFPFSVKKFLAQQAGVPGNRFIRVKSPFKAEEITQMYDPNDTQLIFVRSEKDAGTRPQPGGVLKDGSPAYLQPYKRNGLEPFSKHGYMAYLPTVQFGPGMTSATEIRAKWPEMEPQQKISLVKNLYPATEKNDAAAGKIVSIFDEVMGGVQEDSAGSQRSLMGAPVGVGAGGLQPSNTPMPNGPDREPKGVRMGVEFDEDSLDRSITSTGITTDVTTTSGGGVTTRTSDFKMPEPDLRTQQLEKEKAEITARLKSSGYTGNQLLQHPDFRAINRKIRGIEEERVTPAGGLGSYTPDALKSNLVMGLRDIADYLKAGNYAGVYHMLYQDPVFRAKLQALKDADQPVDEDYLEEKWSEKYKRSINCSNPKGFSQKAHCAGRKK